jgi:D-3-phosphoglycerate dehydrogenase
MHGVPTLSKLTWMVVLIADQFERSGLEGLRDLGLEVFFEPDLRDDALAERLTQTEADVLVVRSTKVTTSMIEGSSLRLIIRAGAGYNTIDVSAAHAKGVAVANCPGKNNLAVAELAIGLMIAVDRFIPDCVADLRAGTWNKKRYSKGRGLFGRTLGLIGFGRIGQEVAPRARALGMRVIAFSRWLTPEVAAAAGVGRCDSSIEVAERSDFVSVHVPLTPETKGSLGREFFEAMRPGAVFINTSRAEVVDQPSLEDAVRSGRVRAGLDVFEGEPAAAQGEYSGALRDLPGVYCTHHIGASTEQAQEAIAGEVVAIVKQFISDGTVRNAVSLSDGASASHVLTVRHLQGPGVEQRIARILEDAGTPASEVESVIATQSDIAITQFGLQRRPDDAAMRAIRADEHVLDVTLMEVPSAIPAMTK